MIKIIFPHDMYSMQFTISIYKRTSKERLNIYEANKNSHGTLCIKKFTWDIMSCFNFYGGYHFVDFTCGLEIFGVRFSLLYELLCS